ncbi:MAG: hypothetical protein QOH31_3437 [Verrucomicrobiota bacterium]
MLASIENDKDIHLGPQIDPRTGRRVILFEMHRAILGNHNLAEEVNVSDEVRFTQSPFAKFNQKLVSRVSMEFVALLLKAGSSVLSLHQRGRGMASQRIMPSATICRNGAKHVTHVAVQDMAGCEFRGMLSFQGIGEI